MADLSSACLLAWLRMRSNNACAALRLEGARVLRMAAAGDTCSPLTVQGMSMDMLSTSSTAMQG